MDKQPEKLNIHNLQAMRDRGTPIAMLTAYDYPSALLADQSGMEMILVGDSLGMVVHGFESTIPVTMDMMILHCQAVKRGVSRAFVVVDMPFMSYQASTPDAMRNAARLLAEGGADAVKLEGGRRMEETVHALVDSGIAVMGHIGLTPQSVSAMGGFKIQGKTVETAKRLLADAKALEAAGAFGIVLEAIPDRLAKLITDAVNIPTIGIGAGAGCSGQVLVMHDLLGLFDRFTPRFARQYANLSGAYKGAFEAYGRDVHARRFPAREHSFTMPDDVWAALLASLDGDTASE